MTGETTYIPKEAFEEMLNGVSENGGVKEIAEATPEDFQTKVAEEREMLRVMLVDIQTWNTEKRQILIDVLKDIFDGIQKDLNMAEENFQDIGGRMDTMLLSFDLDATAKQLRELSAQKWV